MKIACASVIYLGRIELRWCNECNLPVLGRTCGICGSETSEVKLTPPGDVRPAFPFDIDLCRKVIREQFGNAILPEVVLLNDVPAVDKMDEVIFNGRVAGAIRYDLEDRKFRFIPRVWFANLIKPTRGFVVADEGAVKPILNGSSLLSPGVIDASREIRKGDEVVIYSPDRDVIAVGKAYMDSEEMVKSNHGMAVKVRWKGIEDETEIDDKTWDDVLKANEDIISGKVGEAKGFIRKVARENNMPMAVSFSGGKDSLATLFLVMDAGYRPPIFFINTGLEFDETVAHVRNVAGQLGLEFMEENAGDIFWKAIDFFGPSARDFRWCCKTCKLGPTSRLIEKHFPGGVLSFIGQRRYESEQRSRKGNIWRNPWVAGQVGASPIQNWTALHVWLYLFRKYREYGIKWNELYEQGFSRIGCWLCPASDMAEFEFKKHRDWNRLMEKLEEYAENHGMGREWIDNGMWRWVKPPKWAAGTERKEVERDERIGREEIERIGNALNAIGDVAASEGGYEVGNVSVSFSGGKVAVVSDDGKKKEKVESVVERALNCMGCGVCTGQCRYGAIHIRDERAWIDGEKCIHCGECLNICPVVVFGRRENFAGKSK